MTGLRRRGMKALAMSNTPHPSGRVNPAWFVAWLIGGVSLSGLSVYLIGVYFDSRPELIFQPVNPSPEVVRRRFLLESIPYLHLVLLAYAALGVWRFRWRGGLAIGAAVVFGCCTNLYMSVAGVGR